VSAEKRLKKQRERRKLRVRGKLLSKGEKPRVSVFRSLNHIYVQIVDDSTQNTLVSASSLSVKDSKSDKSSIAKKVGLELGKLAKEKSINNVFFDRGQYCYHGRVKALAEGLREGGLKF